MRRGMRHLAVDCSSSSSEGAPRARLRRDAASSSSTVTAEAGTSTSKTSLTSSIHRFRSDFENLQCKGRIFGESVSLCRCIANDFQKRMTFMESRLQSLEQRQCEKNYSAIIQKNQRLSHKTKQDAKKLQMCGTEEEMREVAGRICRNYLHGAWKSTDPRDLDFKRISGGLSNFLYYVALPADASRLGGFQRESSPDSDPDVKLKKQLLTHHSFSIDEPKKVLLRIYGQVHGERAMDAIVTESVIFTLLSERRLGPKLHGVFSGGRIEEYIPARPLLTKELSEPALSMKIAEKMAAIHSMDVPLSKEPNWLWKTMAKWLRTVKEERLAAPPANMREEERQIMERLRGVEWEAEVEWVKRRSAALGSPVVFCHNDMQEGNILILEDELEGAAEGAEGAGGAVGVGGAEGSEGESYSYKEADSASLSSAELGEPRLVLIDFEYCAYNYRAFDIANHFQEWCYDYTNPEHPFYYENYEMAPSLEQKEIFIKEYLKHYRGEGEGGEPTIDDVNQLLDEIDAFALASHLLWSLWSAVNASKSQIPFGYWEYALTRLETYLRLKQELIKKDKYGFPQKRKICEVDI